MPTTTLARPNRASLVDATVRIDPRYAKPERREWLWTVVTDEPLLGTTVLVHKRTGIRTNAMRHTLRVVQSAREVRQLAAW